MRYPNYFYLLFIFFISGCCASLPLLEPDSDELSSPAPSEFKVEFNTNKGIFLIKIDRELSPLAVDRFYYLITNKYYYQNRFFRVIPNFVVQWGMKGVPELDEIWGNLGIDDEPVKSSNTKGAISFARSGPNTRSNQVFINLADNKRLDTSDYNDVDGFPAFGKVIEGMEIVESINAEYKQQPNQDSIRIKGNIYLNKNFPNLDYIISIKIVE